MIKPRSTHCHSITWDRIMRNVHLNTRFWIGLESTIGMNSFGLATMFARKHRHWQAEVWSLVLAMGNSVPRASHAADPRKIENERREHLIHLAENESEMFILFTASLKEDNMGYHKNHVKRKHMFGLTWEATVRETERLGDARIRLGWFHWSAIRPLTQTWYRYFTVITQAMLLAWARIFGDEPSGHQRQQKTGLA